MGLNYDAWLQNSSAYDEYAGCGEEYDVDEDGNVMDEQYYRDRDADEWYARMKDEGGLEK